MTLTSLTLTEAAALLQKREITAVELTQEHLTRIKQIDPLLNSFITVLGDSALDAARNADYAIQLGEYRGPLHGIPLAIKDLFETAGVRTTAGSSFLAHYVPNEDCAVVQKLNAAGAINLGKLNMHEWAMGATNQNATFGPCKNPWNRDHIPGGSSGGSGAALAADLCMGSLGTDTGGSIRIPASLCGIVGLKPTYGRISTRGVIPLSWSLDHVGPLARCVRDVALLFQVIAGYDAADPHSIDWPVADYTAQLDAGVQGWRVGLLQGEHFDQADPEILAAVQAAAQQFTHLGAQVDAVDLPGSLEARRTNPLMIACDAAAFHKARVHANPEAFEARILARLQEGLAYTATDYAEARQIQLRLRRQFENAFGPYDILLAPTNPVAAPPQATTEAAQQAKSMLPNFTTPFNFTGFPALSLPCGFTQAGLPIGLQIIGRHWAEAQVLQAAAAYEQTTEWHLLKPPLATDLAH